MYQRLLRFVFIILLGGCATQPSEHGAITAKDTADIIPDGITAKQLRAKLMAFHHQWQGVPYRLGGMSKSGVDCSGFVYLAYQNLFDKHLPRTTADQVNLGQRINKKQLKVGDLVFFKTGWSTRHVGIYVGRSQFLHASTSQGVMLSSLNNSYWQQKYWLSKAL